MHTNKKKWIYYHSIISIVNHVTSLHKGVVPTAPEQPADEVENHIKLPDDPPDYNSHFVPGRLNIQKRSFLSPENHTNH